MTINSRLQVSMSNAKSVPSGAKIEVPSKRTDDFEIVVTSSITYYALLLLYCITVLFCSLPSVVVVCRLSSSVTLPAGGRAGLPLSTWAVGRPTLHGGPIRLRLVRATPCYHHSLHGSAGLL